MEKKAKVVMLPTEKASELLICAYDNMLHLRKDYGDAIKSETYGEDKYQHLYILSDDIIQERDYFKVIGSDTIHKCLSSEGKSLESSNGLSYLYVFCEKIIATTDKSLGLPQPSKDFINRFVEEYNRGNVIEDVFVEYYEGINEHGETCEFNPKTREDNTIIISQDKPEVWSDQQIRDFALEFQKDNCISDSKMIWIETGMKIMRNLIESKKD